MKIAIASDEKTALTDVLLEELRARGHELVLFGPIAEGDAQIDWPQTSANAARQIGLADRKGSLKLGYDADVVLLDDANQVAMTIAGGRVVYRA